MLSVVRNKRNSFINIDCILDLTLRNILCSCYSYIVVMFTKRQIHSLYKIQNVIKYDILLHSERKFNKLGFIGYLFARNQHTFLAHTICMDLLYRLWVTCSKYQILIQIVLQASIQNISYKIINNFIRNHLLYIFRYTVNDNMK